MMFDHEIYEKLKKIDAVLHAALSDEVILDRMREQRVFDKLADAECPTEAKLLSHTYQAVSDITMYIETNRYQLSNMLTQQQMQAQLLSEYFQGYKTISDCSHEMEQIKYNLNSIHLI